MICPRGGPGASLARSVGLGLTVEERVLADVHVEEGHDAVECDDHEPERRPEDDVVIRNVAARSLGRER